MLLFVASCLLGQAAPEVELVRLFTGGQTYQYEVKSHLLAEYRAGAMSFFMPQEFDVNYGFTMKVEDARKDGFAVVLYDRPNMNFIDGETAEHPPQTKVEKVGIKYRLTLSPINEITDAKDLNPKKPNEKKEGGFVFLPTGTARQDAFFGKLVQELNSLAMFVGNLDSSLDFSPKLPLDSVKPGATWKKTVGYQPRELKGTEKQAVQRLDYTYKYEGLVDSNGKKVYRVSASLDLDTDAMKFLNQVMGLKPDENEVKELRLQLKTKVVYDLDEKTKATLKASADSKGGFSITLNSDPDKPVYEEKITGRSTMVLASVK